MSTVLERFNHLGLASSKPVLSKAGEIIRERWRIVANTYQRHDELTEKSQTEGTETFLVNNYPDDWNPEMDRLILEFINS